MAERKKCEGCGLKAPSYGLPAEGRRRWCVGCAAAEGGGAVSLAQKKMCERCGYKSPSYGLPAERKMRWCSGCAAEEGRGAVQLQQTKMCEGCGQKTPSYGLPPERTKRWCIGCATTSHPEAVRCQPYEKRSRAQPSAAKACAADEPPGKRRRVVAGPAQATSKASSAQVSSWASLSSSNPDGRSKTRRIRRTNAELELGLVGNDKILAYRKETGCKPQKPGGISKKTHGVQERPERR